MSAITARRRGDGGRLTIPSWASSHWAPAYSTARSGGSQARILVLGDSIPQGYYTTFPYYTNGFIPKMAASLQALTGVYGGTGVVGCFEDNMVVLNGSGTGVGEDRIALTGTWTKASAPLGPYTRACYFTDQAGTYTFGPVTCSAFRVYYVTNSNCGAVTAKIDGSSVTGYNGNGSLGIASVDMPAGSLGSHTLELKAPAAAGSYMILNAVEGLANTSAGGVSVSRYCMAGSKTTDASPSGIDDRSLNVLSQPSAHLAILSFGINDAIANTNPATAFNAAYQTVITRLKTTLGVDVMLMVPPPPDPASSVSAGTWSSYVSAIQTLASTNTCGLCDITARWGSYGASTSFYFDQFHPNQTGANDIAIALFNTVKAGAGVP